MKSYRTIFFLVISLVVFLLQSGVPGAEGPGGFYFVDAGKIVLYTDGIVKSVTVDGSIDRHCRGDGGIYYITVKAVGGSGVPYIGFADMQSGDVRYEKKLPFGLDEFALRKFMAAEGVAYILAEPKASTGTGRILHRINLNTMEADRLPDVLDYHIEGRDLVILSKGGSGITLTRNETSVPITLPGEGLLGISAIMDGRMVFVTNGDETEIVDIRAGRALYRYANNREFMMPDEFNMVIQAEDSMVSERDDREMVFFKVFIDGTESGRTDSGPVSLAREFRVKVEANKYHLVKLERWVLNAARGRYDRENNIRQPRAEHVFVPMNRIVKISIKFDGRNYHYGIVPVYK